MQASHKNSPFAFAEPDALEPKTTDIGDVARLIELSRDRADCARSQLAANLAHFAITSGRDLATDEWALLDDIFIRLMQHMEAVVRKALAERIAAMDEPPRQLVRALAYDEICVAGPVLRGAKRLEDQDLIAIARRMTPGHRVAIAERAGLTPLVSEALVESGETEVAQKLLKNRSARISKLTFRKLVRSSQSDPAIQGLILERSGIPRSLLVEMFWFVAGNYRQKIISRFDVELSVLKRQFHEGIEDALMELQTDPVAAAAINTIKDSKPNCAALVEELFAKVRAGRIEPIISIVAQMGGIPVEIASQIIRDEKGEALAILCKTVGIQKTQFVQLHLALDAVRDGAPRPFSHINEVTRLYETISWEAAEFILRYWAADNVGGALH